MISIYCVYYIWSYILNLCQYPNCKDCIFLSLFFIFKQPRHSESMLTTRTDHDQQCFANRQSSEGSSWAAHSPLSVYRRGPRAVPRGQQN